MRNEDYQFLPTDPTTIESDLIAQYEELTGQTVHPASAERQFISWVANVIIQERVMTNFVANQNIPSRAIGENLDGIGELFFQQTRPGAKSATTTERFYISESQSSTILIPAGTRVTDADSAVYFETLEDKYIEIGSTYADVQVRCMTAGTAGNGYAIGQLNVIVDVYDYYSKCENTTISDGGADIATDEEFYDLLRSSMDAYSCAGAKGGYEYHAKKVSTKIQDVIAMQPSPGCVDIYVLMDDGTLASTEIKNAVLRACNADEVRPLTDKVSVKDASQVEYNIDITYYITAGTDRDTAEIEAAVKEAVDRYVTWQNGKLGRDINPDKLRDYLYEAGVKRIDLRAPTFTKLKDGSDQSAPQIAKLGARTVTNGGFEDE